jgi:hypothetical protein
MICSGSDSTIVEMHKGMRHLRLQELLILRTYSKLTQVDFQVEVCLLLKSKTNIVGHPGQSPVKRNRCSDRFVRYPYPGCAVSYYQKEFPNKIG